jgi:Ribonuclease G/E
VRTSAEEASDADLVKDLDYLLLTWARIHDLTLKSYLERLEFFAQLNLPNAH